MISDKFSRFINEKIIEWNDKMGQKRGNKFPVLSQMAKMFKETTLVSSKKNLLSSLERHGRFHQLIKSSKTKRINNEEKVKEEIKKKDLTDCIERQKEIIEDLKMELVDFKSKYEDRERDTQLLQNLYNNGYIDLDGNPVDK